MARYPETETAAQPTREGDTEFLGVNEKLSRDLLESGYAHRAVNKRMRDRRAATRWGTATPTFANQIDFDQILGSGRYSNPNGPDVLLIATPNFVYAIADSTYPMPIPIPDGVVLDTACEFVQAFDKVLIFRGIDRTPLEWNGLSAAGFTEIVDPTLTTKHRIPNADYAQVFKFRLLVPANRDDVEVSDILNYTQFDPIMENWRINMGSADALVRIFPFANNSVLMFKGQSLLLHANFEDAQHPEKAQLQILNPNTGLHSRHAVAQVGGDVHFLSRNQPGIWRVTQIIQDRIVTHPVPVSDPIAPLIARINWEVEVVAQPLGEYVFWAMAIDGCAYRNAIAVWNNATQQWESNPDVWSPSGRGPFSGQNAGELHVDALHVMNYHGKAALYCVDAHANAVCVLYVPGALTDALPHGEFEIADLLSTRGYATLGWNAATQRDFQRVEIGISTWRPSIKVSEITDSAQDSRGLNETAITKDRTKYMQWGKPDYDVSNANDDFHAPGREDFSVVPGDGVLPGVNGISPALQQQSLLRFSTKARGRWIAYDVENTQGRCGINGVLVESAADSKTQRRAA
jgi:hypothetical protein